MSTVLEEFVGKLGWQVDKRGPAEFKKQSLTIGAGLAKIGALYTVVASAVTGFVVNTNQQTAATYRLAQGMGVSYEWLHRWGAAGKSAGIGVDNIRTASYFLNKTLGAKSSGLNGNLKSIGLSFDEIAGASPEEAFNKVAFAIGNIEDRTVAANVASKLFGRSGGQTFATLGNMAKAQGLTIEEYLNRFKGLEFQTEKSAKGAADFAASWGALTFALDEVKAAFAGLIGEAMTPMLKDVRGWIAANKELLKQKLVEWARSVAKWLKDVWTFISKIAGVIGGVIGKVGGLNNALKIVIGLWLGSKLLSATKNVDKLSFKLQGAAIKAGLLQAGLLAVSMIAFDDLMSSIDDISNESWGNRIARTMSRLTDQTIIWVAEMAGLYFKSDADRATFLAAMSGYSVAAFDDAVANIGVFIDNIQNQGMRLLLWFVAVKKVVLGGGDPKTVAAELSKGLANYAPQKYQDTRGGYIKAAISSTGQAKDAKQQVKNAVESLAHLTTNNSVFNIHPSAGMNETDLAYKVEKAVGKHMKRAVRHAEAAGTAR